MGNFLAVLGFLIIIAWLIKRIFSKSSAATDGAGPVIKFDHLPEGDVLADGESWILNRHQFSRHFPAVLGDAAHTLPATAAH